MSDNDALKQRGGSPTLWFDPAMSSEAAPSGRRGRQPRFSDAAIQVCLTLKVRFGLRLRQTTGFVARLRQLAGRDWPVPDFSTLCRPAAERGQKTLSVNIACRGGTGPLHLLIDATGIKAESEGEWSARKHGGSRKRLWRKLHLGMDEGKADREGPRWGVYPTSWRSVRLGHNKQPRPLSADFSHRSPVGQWMPYAA